MSQAPALIVLFALWVAGLTFTGVCYVAALASTIRGLERDEGIGSLLIWEIAFVVIAATGMVGILAWKMAG